MHVLITCKYEKDPIGLLVSEIFMFESVDARTDAGLSPIL